VQTVNRIIDVFPPYQQAQVRANLSFVLEGVLSQQLIPRLSGNGRVLALEVMVPNVAIRNLIREDKVHQIYSQMQVGQSKYGMLTLNQSLLNLVQKRMISVDEALGRTAELDEFRSMLINAGIAANGQPPPPGPTPPQPPSKKPPGTG
jgi:twitching motility protein PilT